MVGRPNEGWEIQPGRRKPAGLLETEQQNKREILRASCAADAKNGLTATIVVTDWPDRPMKRTLTICSPYRGYRSLVGTILCANMEQLHDAMEQIILLPTLGIAQAEMKFQRSDNNPLALKTKPRLKDAVS